MKEYLDQFVVRRLVDEVKEIGFMVITGEDNCLAAPINSMCRFPGVFTLPFGHGEVIRDWTCNPSWEVLWPNEPTGERLDVAKLEKHIEFLWTYRTSLKERKAFGVPVEEKGIPWWAIREVYSDKISTPLSIVFSFVATHNHFVIDRGGKVFNRSAPVIKLPATATEDDHLALLGLLNSSTACFWMKQVFYPKATSTGDISTEKGKPEANRYEIAGTGLEKFPVPFSLSSSQAKRIGAIAKTMDLLANKLISLRPSSIMENCQQNTSVDLEGILKTAEVDHDIAQKRMICLQEELDWEVYKIFKLTEEGANQSILNDQAVGIAVDDRPFVWVKDSIPDNLPESISSLYEKRRQVIQSNKQIRFIEDPVFKRPWWGRQGVYGRLAQDYKGWTDEALATWLLNRLESYFDLDGRMNDPITPPSPTLGEGGRGGRGC